MFTTVSTMYTYYSSIITQFSTTNMSTSSRDPSERRVPSLRHVCWPLSSWEYSGQGCLLQMVTPNAPSEHCLDVRWQHNQAQPQHCYDVLWDFLSLLQPQPPGHVLTPWPRPQPPGYAPGPPWLYPRLPVYALDPLMSGCILSTPTRTHVFQTP